MEKIYVNGGIFIKSRYFACKFLTCLTDPNTILALITTFDFLSHTRIGFRTLCFVVTGTGAWV